MPPKKSSPPKRKDPLIITLENLNETVLALKEQEANLHHPGRNFSLFFLRGIFYGFGMLVAFAIVVPLLVEIFRWVEWVPIIGDFLLEIVENMETANQVR